MTVIPTSTVRHLNQWLFVGPRTRSTTSLAYIASIPSKTAVIFRRKFHQKRHWFFCKMNRTVILARVAYQKMFKEYNNLPIIPGNQSKMELLYQVKEFVAGRMLGNERQSWRRFARWIQMAESRRGCDPARQRQSPKWPAFSHLQFKRHVSQMPSPFQSSFFPRWFSLAAMRPAFISKQIDCAQFWGNVFAPIFLFIVLKWTLPVFNLESYQQERKESILLPDSSIVRSIFFGFFVGEIFCMSFGNFDFFLLRTICSHSICSEMRDGGIDDMENTT